MNSFPNLLCRTLAITGRVAALATLSTLTLAQDSESELGLALEAIQATPPTPASQLPQSGTFYSGQHAFDWPPLPANMHDLAAWPLGEGLFLLDDADFDYEALARLLAAAGYPAGGRLLSFQSRSFTSNELWLEIHGVTNEVTGWTADLTMHLPWNDTNWSYDMLYAPTLDSPTQWRFLMRCPTTNVSDLTNFSARWLCEEQGFFALSQTNGELTVTTNVTPQEMAELLMPPWVSVTNAAFTGSNAARGTFTNGNGCGLPIETGVILSSGPITNAVGPNSDGGDTAAYYGYSDLKQPGDADLSKLVGNGPTLDATLLEFDVLSTNSFILQIRYVLGSEEYPEFIALYNDPVAIFVSTNRMGTNWVVTATNNVALLPGKTNVMVGISTVNGGWVEGQLAPTNAQYYTDNHDRNYSAQAPFALDASVFNVQPDGMTVLLQAQIPISGGVTNRLKIGVADYAGESGEDAVYDSVLLLTPWSPEQCP